MSANTKIEWADHTFNPWIGCTKVGPGCDNCYAKAEWDDRRHRAVWGAGQPRSRTQTWGDPVTWNKNHEAFYAEHGRRQRVFCASLADWADNEVDEQWRRDLGALILATPNLDWLLLTKRIGNAAKMLAVMFPDGVPANVRIGASICNQEEADRDIAKLLALGLPTFLSMEPLLGPVDLSRWLWKCCGCPVEGLPGDGYFQPPDGPQCCGHGVPSEALHWIIVGGESGPGARPMHPDWARSLRDQCEAAGVPFLFKQWGEWTGHEVDPNGTASHLMCIDAKGGSCALSRNEDAKAKGEPWWHLPAWPGRGTWGPDGIPPGVVEVRRTGKKAAGRLLDGRTWDEVPR